MKVYVASSWRNEYQPAVVDLVRGAGFDVYDFRNPDGPGKGGGFAWSEIDLDWQGWNPSTFARLLDHEIAERGFAKDIAALEACDLCILVLPCGRSAHLECGFAAGIGAETIVYIPEPVQSIEPELMYKMLGPIATDEDTLWAYLEGTADLVAAQRKARTR